MLGDMLNTNKKKDVKTRIDQILFYGKKYVQDPRTGYYVCTSTRDRKRLHVAIWEQVHGVKVPPGCVIHHMDWNKTNNDVGNLLCVTHEEHNLIHNPPKVKGQKKLIETAESERVVKLTQELVASRDGAGLPPGYGRVI